MLCYAVLCVVPLSCGSSSRPQDTPPPEIHQLRYQESSRGFSFSVSAASCEGIDYNCLLENLIMLFLLSLLMQFIRIYSFEVRLQMLSYHIFESRIPPSHCTALQVAGNPDSSHGKKIRQNRPFYEDWLLPRLR